MTFSRSEYLFIYIYLYGCILYTSSSYRTHIYIHRECRSVLVKLHPITVYRTAFGCLVPVLNPTCCFLRFHQLSCFMINRLILGCLWPLVYVLSNNVTLGILRLAIFHLPGRFCPLDLLSEYRIQHGNIDPFMSHLDNQLGYSTGECESYFFCILT